MPISRFLQFLLDSENLQGYMDRLAGAFNPAAVEALMCRSTLSVGWTAGAGSSRGGATTR